MTPEQIQGNKMIAEYMGHNVIFDIVTQQWCCQEIGYSEIVKMGYYSLPRYQDDWKLQIPVYSKLAKAMKETAAQDHYEKHRYFNLLNKYEKAVFNNEPAEGFKIIIENLTWYNTLTSKQSKQ